MRIKILVTTAALALLFWACAKKDSGGSPTGNEPPSLHSDAHVAYMEGRLGASDSIDSSGTWYRGHDTLYWVMETDSAEYDTVPALVMVRNDTASVSGAVVSGFSASVTINGTVASGTGDSFPGSVWKVNRIAIANPPDSLSTAPLAGTALYVYFSARNGKVYTADVNGAMDKLESALILECPYAFLRAYIQVLGYQIDTVRSDCDTMWVTFKNFMPPFDTIDGYVVGNPATLMLDIYIPPSTTKLTSIPVGS